MGHRNPAGAAEIGHWHQRLAHAAAKYTRESMDISPVGAGRALVVSSRRCGSAACESLSVNSRSWFILNSPNVGAGFKPAPTECIRDGVVTPCRSDRPVAPTMLSAKFFYRLLTIVCLALLLRSLKHDRHCRAVSLDRCVYVFQHPGTFHVQFTAANLRRTIYISCAQPRHFGSQPFCPRCYCQLGRGLGTGLLQAVRLCHAWADRCSARAATSDLAGAYAHFDDLRRHLRHIALPLFLAVLEDVRATGRSPLQCIVIVILPHVN